MTNADLKEKTKHAKRECLRICMEGGYGPISSAFSCADILAVLYYDVLRLDPANPDDGKRDRLILSKNHAGIMVMPILYDLGFISETDYQSILKVGSEMTSHTDIRFPGMEFSGGALGIGLGFASGIAYAAKADKDDYLTICIVGDAECCEGSVWEAAMFAATNKLGNLVVIVDNNGLAVTDYTSHMINMSSVEQRWASFGWEVERIDGHDLPQLRKTFQRMRSRESVKPLCIIADTKKGKGLDFMENKLGWHGRLPMRDQLDCSMRQLEEE